ncbi:hypothetical protein AB0M12_36520 [Nocardia vinacea]
MQFVPNTDGGPYLKDGQRLDTEDIRSLPALKETGDEAVKVRVGIR